MVSPPPKPCSRSLPPVPVIVFARSSPAVPAELSPKRISLPFANVTLDVASCCGAVFCSTTFLV